MHMRLGLSTAAYYGRFETEDAALAIARLPVDCAEVFLQTGSEYEPAFAQLVRENLGSISCTSVHPTGIQFENQMFGRSLRQRRDAFAVYERVLDAANVLGAKYYVYHGRSTAQLTALAWDLEANLRVLRDMHEAAAERNIAVAWENVFWCQLTNEERIAKVRDVFPDARFTLDIKQAMRAGCDPVKMIDVMGSGLANVHVCDWMANGKLCLPGEGEFDFDALFAALRKNGYDGPVILEPYLALVESDETLMRSLEFLRSKMRSAK